MTIEELHQTKFWTDGDGNTMRVRDMSPSHRLNLLNWIERNAGTLRRSECNAAWNLSIMFNGEMALDSIDHEIDRLEGMDDEVYVDQLPFVIKLRKRVAKDVVLPLKERSRLNWQARTDRERARIAKAVDSFDELDPSEVVRPQLSPNYATRPWRETWSYQSQTERERIAELEQENADLRDAASADDLWGDYCDHESGCIHDDRFAVNG